MGELNAWRGKVLGTQADETGEQVISALVPESELARYAVALRSLTGGRGRFVDEHARYEPPPAPPVGRIRQDVHDAERRREATPPSPTTTPSSDSFPPDSPPPRCYAPPSPPPP